MEICNLRSLTSMHCAKSAPCHEIPKHIRMQPSYFILFNFKYALRGDFTYLYIPLCFAYCYYFFFINRTGLMSTQQLNVRIHISCINIFTRGFLFYHSKPYLLNYNHKMWFICNYNAHKTAHIFILTFVSLNQSINLFLHFFSERL